MKFDSHKSIYLQIADLIMESILEKKWKENERIPSVRELAGNIEVNPNTVMRSYSYLQENNILENKRGIGLYVDTNALENIKMIKKEAFINNDLPRLAKTLNVLGITVEELQTLLKKVDYKL